jgi:GT2 family glycosyltransferase
MSGEDPPPVLTVVVLSWNTRELTLACLRALAADRARHAREVIVLDNASHDGSADAIARAHPEVVLVRNAHNAGYAAGNNQGARLARGAFVCLLNSDTEPRPGALDLLVDFLRTNPRYGAVAPLLRNPDGTVQRACMGFPGIATALTFDTVFARFWPGKWFDDRYFMRAFDHRHSRDVPQPPGACLLVRRDEYLERGGLDEDLFLFFNDVDLCRRYWAAGRRIRYFAPAEVVHHGGASTRGFEKFVVTWHKNRLSYYRKHHGRWAERLVRVMVRWRALEEWFRLGQRHRDRGARAAARSDLRRHLREVLAT